MATLLLCTVLALSADSGGVAQVSFVQPINCEDSGAIGDYCAGCDTLNSCTAADSPENQIQCGNSGCCGTSCNCNSQSCGNGCNTCSCGKGSCRNHCGCKSGKCFGMGIGLACCGIGAHRCSSPSPWVSSGNMPQHMPYESEPKTYYYYRPYNHHHIAMQQEGADDPTLPYSNSVFASVYAQMELEAGLEPIAPGIDSGTPEPVPVPVPVPATPTVPSVP